MFKWFKDIFAESEDKIKVRDLERELATLRYEIDNSYTELPDHLVTNEYTPLSKTEELFIKKAIRYSKQFDLVKALSTCNRCGEEKHSTYAQYEIESAKLKKVGMDLYYARSAYERECKNDNKN